MENITLYNQFLFISIFQFASKSLKTKMNTLKYAVSVSEECVRIVALHMEKMKILKTRYDFLK